MSLGHTQRTRHGQDNGRGVGLTDDWCGGKGDSEVLQLKSQCFPRLSMAWDRNVQVLLSDEVDVKEFVVQSFFFGSIGRR